jgi:hypothetical protein
LNIPAVTAIVHGWPMLLIFLGLVMLVIHPVSESHASGPAAGESTRSSHGLRS